MARLLSRCVHTSSVHSWIETVNVGSYKQNLTPQTSLVQEGSTSRWAAAAVCHALLHTRHLSRFTASFHRLLVRHGGRRLWACQSPFNRKGKAMQSSLANMGELWLYVSPSPCPVSQSSPSLYPWPDLTDLLGFTSTHLFVCKAFQLGHGGTEELKSQPVN